MPNLVFQELHVVAARRELDRFIRTGLVLRRRGEMDNVLDFERLCPLGRADNPRTYSHASGVVLGHFRTYTYARLAMITNWAYPAEFYARLATQWPSIAFLCEVQEEMGAIEGVVSGIDGQGTNLVSSDVDNQHDLLAHRRLVRGHMKLWHDVVTLGRPWRLVVPAWRFRPIQFDVHLDDNFWFYFRTREDLARFKGKYKAQSVMRRVGRRWLPTRVSANA